MSDFPHANLALCSHTLGVGELRHPPEANRFPSTSSHPRPWGCALRQHVLTLQPSRLFCGWAAPGIAANHYIGDGLASILAACAQAAGPFRSHWLCTLSLRTSSLLSSTLR